MQLNAPRQEENLLYVTQHALKTNEDNFPLGYDYIQNFRYVSQAANKLKKVCSVLYL